MTLAPKNLEKLELLSRQPVADHGIFRIERLRYAGFPRDITVVACNDWCNVIAETEAGEIVLVWQYRFGTNAFSLEIPGGVVDPGEDPEAAALRELREETGYEATSLELLCSYDPNPAIQGNRMLTYIARGARLVGPTAFDELEELETVLVPKADLPGLLDRGEITHALIVCALETYLRRTRARTA